MIGNKISMMALTLAMVAAPALAQTIPSGSEIKVRTDTAIQANTSQNLGRRYQGRITQDVTDSAGQVIIPRGSPATLTVVRDGKEVALDLTSVSANGRRYAVVSKGYKQGGVGKNERTAKWAGGGALAGAVIGAIAGGGKGAAIGALAGGAAGAGAQTYTKGRSLDIKPETELNFKLAQDLQLQPMARRRR